jgi:hypothetical protein
LIQALLVAVIVLTLVTVLVPPERVVVLVMVPFGWVIVLVTVLPPPDLAIVLVKTFVTVAEFFVMVVEIVLVLLLCSSQDGKSALFEAPHLTVAHGRCGYSSSNCVKICGIVSPSPPL